MTRGAMAENKRELIALAQLHGDLDAIAIIQERLTRHLFKPNSGCISTCVTFEGKKHLWNMLSRLTSRVESAIISDRGLQREVIHLAAKGRKDHD